MEPKQAQNETLVKPKRIWISTDKKGLLGILIGTLISLIPFIGSVIGAFAGGFISRKTLNGVIASAIGSVIGGSLLFGLQTFPGNIGATIILVILLAIFFALIGVIPSYVGRIAARRYYKEGDETKENEINTVPKNQTSVNDTKLIHCPKCGAENSEGSNYCLECGSDIKFDDLS
jgi:hypothetical protein